ncbi:MAG: hypothetical protein JNL01_12250 [Bdellovibrionales bacterium]|nr:hypothetical protein [Bdellovibrionales bacterium]
MAADLIFRRKGAPDCKVEIETQLNVLAHSQLGEIFIGSQCGGHGKCGKDRVRIDPKDQSRLSPVTSAERLHLSEGQIAEGYRLGCQCWPNDPSRTIVADVEAIDPREREVL